MFVVAVQSLSRVWLFAAPWTAAHQASLSFTISQSLLKFMSIELAMPSNYLILCRPLLLLPSIFPSIRVFSSELVLHIRWAQDWCFSFSISPSNEYSHLTSFRIDRFDLLAIQGTLQSLLQNHSSKASILWLSAFYGPIPTTIHDYCYWHPLFFLGSCLPSQTPEHRLMSTRALAVVAVIDLYDAVLVSSIQKSKSAIITHISPPSSHHRPSHRAPVLHNTCSPATLTNSNYFPFYDHSVANFPLHVFNWMEVKQQHPPSDPAIIPSTHTTSWGPALQVCSPFSRVRLFATCPTLCAPLDCGASVSSVQANLQARILERAAISFLTGYSRPRDWTQVSCIAGGFCTVWATREAPELCFPHSW